MERTVSVQMPPSISTGPDCRTVPRTTTGDFSISWSSVGITMVVARAGMASANATSRTHHVPYTLIELI